MRSRRRGVHSLLAVAVLLAFAAAPTARAESPSAGQPRLELDGLALHGGPFDYELHRGTLLPLLAEDPLGASQAHGEVVQPHQASFWRKLHPILGWTSVAAFAANAFIGPVLKGMADSNVDPDHRLNIVHGSIAGISTLAWIGSLSALLAQPPEGATPKPAHRILGWIQVPLFVGTIVMGEVTRTVIDTPGNMPSSSTPFSLVHNWLVLGTLIVYTTVALLSL